jgi:hypothetical protein
MYLEWNFNFPAPEPEDPELDELLLPLLLDLEEDPELLEEELELADKTEQVMNSNKIVLAINSENWFLGRKSACHNSGQ